MRKLLFGKVPPEDLLQSVFPYLGVQDSQVLVGPRFGEDAAVLNFGKKVLVVSSDPITGAIKNLGWLAVHINANDIATMGAKPRWFLAIIFLPEKPPPKLLEKLMKQIDMASKELKISVIGGHSEVSPGFSRPIIAGSMIGETTKQKFVTSSGARPKDLVILTKGVAIEGTSILATDFENQLRSKFSIAFVRKAQGFIKMLSVVPEALTAVNVSGVTAMHDPTEGGIVGGLYELAQASNVGLLIDYNKIPILPETAAICNFFNIDPLQTISSGSLIITSKPNKAKKIIKALTRKKIRAEIIGKVVKKEEGIKILYKKKVKILSYPKQDHLWKVFAQLK